MTSETDSSRNIKRKSRAKLAYDKRCHHCGSEFTAGFKLAKYCHDCRSPSNGGLRGDIAYALGKRTAKALHGPKVCLACGQHFMTRYKYAVVCSKECNFKWLGMRAAPLKMAKEKAAVNRKMYRQWASANRALQRKAKDSAERAQERLLRPSETLVCRECNQEFASSGLRKVFCSNECRSRDSKRTSRKKRKAIQRGAKVESVNSSKVFDRDAWRCQMCGIKTPRRKRGTCEPDAPELDHIIPLSQGGEHSYRNTQCLCRSCNASKSDTILGQLRMFGGVSA